MHECKAAPARRMACLPHLLIPHLSAHAFMHSCIYAFMRLCVRKYAGHFGVRRADRPDLEGNRGAHTAAADRGTRAPNGVAPRAARVDSRAALRVAHTLAARAGRAASE